jgi:hypothetical protein
MKDSINGIIEAAMTRFSTATEDMRRTAGEIRTELEETRADLQRGVLDMPVEAKESTSAIRNAVSEQIKALKELSEIVARTGRTVDVYDPRQPRQAPPPAAAAQPQYRSEPAPRQPEPVARQPEPMRAAEAAVRQPEPQYRQPEPQYRPAEPVRQAAQVRQPEPRQPEPQYRQPEPQPYRAADTQPRQAQPLPPRQPAPPVEPRRAEPAPRVVPGMDPLGEAPRRDAAPAGQASPWVRDLLRGASRDEAPEAPARPAPARPASAAESLSSLSVDIARAIDHDAAIELWDRYRRGERDVFTRRLYTLKGQQTFDDIRRKYQQDQDFRSAVDRYCDDFEKLLADVARNDHDNIMVQTYLSSDTGKVYTMLAHAADRLR